MDKIIKQIRKLETRDVWPLALLILSFIPGKIYHIIYPKVWIITEYENTARDNGYWLFKYVREKYPKQIVYYPINLKTSDYKKVAEFGNVIKFGGFFHYMLFWGSDKFIGTSKTYGLPYGRICEDLVFWEITSFKYVFLNHGVARGYSLLVDGNQTNYQMLVSMSEKEKKIIVDKNNQDPDIVQTLGFCRHDNLNDDLLDTKQILIMPTWRSWLDTRLSTDGTEKTKNKFFESAYYKKWLSLINNETFINFLEENNFTVIFYLHEYAQVYSKYFQSKSKRIKVGLHDDYLVQDLLKSSIFLVTDYSSVTYDFCYMNKTMAYYQFDKKLFEENQYSESEEFTYENDGFGPVFENEMPLVDYIIKKAEDNYINNEKYANRMQDFYKHRDNKNCERNYNAILNL